MDMYVNPSESPMDHQTNDFGRQQQPLSTTTSNLNSPYITNDTVVRRTPEDFYSSMAGDITSGVIAGAGYNVGFPANDEGSRRPSKEKTSLKLKQSTGDNGSSTLGSPFPGQFFQTGGADSINLGGGARGDGQIMAINRVNTRRYERIDRIAMKLFPIIFILFNVCYWSYYLLLHEAFENLW